MKEWVPFEKLKSEWLKDPSFKKEYDHLSLEYQIALELIKARAKAGYIQEDVAIRMGTTQSVIARLESGHYIPSVKTLNKYAEATGCHLHVSLS